MFTHAQVWSAIDGLAREHSMSASGLARQAGLDATSFNRSKRVNAQGRERWPSMESVAKVLAVTGEPLEQFAKRISSHNAAPDLRQRQRSMRACAPKSPFGKSRMSVSGDEQAPHGDVDHGG